MFMTVKIFFRKETSEGVEEEQVTALKTVSVYAEEKEQQSETEMESMDEGER